jgi:hypothetical protein
MIVVCVIRTAMLEAGSFVNVFVTQLSFARALTETRLFVRILAATAHGDRRSSVWAALVQSCSQHRTRVKSDRQFSRDRQEYRKKSRGLEQRKAGRKRKFQVPDPLPPATRNS